MLGHRGVEPLGEPDTTESDPSESKLLETISEGFFMFLFYLIQSEVCRTLWSQTQARTRQSHSTHQGARVMNNGEHSRLTSES